METKDILKLLRKQKGFSTMQEFCAASNISFSTYQNYEAGKRLPTAELLMQIAKFYGVTTDYLLGMEPAPDPFGELRIDPNDEKAVLDRYMSFPPQTRAVLLDALRQLAGELESEGDAQLPIVEQTTVGAELDRRAADAAAEENAG